MSARRWSAGREAAVLALLTSLSRLPFVGDTLYHWDSINFSLALEEFDVARGQPHVPGYPLYVALCRAVNLLFGDPQTSLSAIAVVASGLAVGTLFLLGARMFDRRVARAAALFLASSPLFWFYGEVALPHALDAFVVIAAVLLLWRAAQGEPRLLVAAGAWLAIAGGLRPQTQLFLAPLFLLAATHAGWRAAATAVVAMVIVDLLWLVPLVQLSGGLDAYLSILDAIQRRFGASTSVLGDAGGFGLRRNALKLGMYTAYGWSAAAVPALLGLAGAWRAGILGRLVLDRRALWIVAWIAPSFAFYLLIHMGQQGLVFVFLPALCLLSALGSGATGRAVLPLAVAANAAIFLLAPTYPLGGDRPKLLTVDTLRRHDAYFQGRFDAIRRRFDPRHAFLVASESRFPEYYLADYRWAQYRIASRWERGEGQPVGDETRVVDAAAMGISADAAGRRYAVLFDAGLEGFLAGGAKTESIALPDGGALVFLVLAPGERLVLGPDRFGVAAEPEAPPP